MDVGSELELVDYGSGKFDFSLVDGTNPEIDDQISRNNEIKQVPFYELMSKLDTLDPNTNYLLYCDKGTMSQLHASHLKTMGYARIAVYTPSSS